LPGQAGEGTRLYTGNGTANLNLETVCGRLSPALAAALISFSFFWCLAISTNLYAMPIDFFGTRHAAFGVSILTASYGLMQTVLSPLIGAMVDHFGFPVVCVSLAVMPLAGIAILRATTRITTQ